MVRPHGDAIGRSIKSTPQKRENTRRPASGPNVRPSKAPLARSPCRLRWKRIGQLAINFAFLHEFFFSPWRIRTTQPREHRVSELTPGRGRTKKPKTTKRNASCQTRRPVHGHSKLSRSSGGASARIQREGGFEKGDGRTRGRSERTPAQPEGWSPPWPPLPPPPRRARANPRRASWHARRDRPEGPSLLMTACLCSMRTGSLSLIRPMSNYAGRV